MGSRRRLDRALAPFAAYPAHHYEARLRSAISLSEGWNAPRRRCPSIFDAEKYVSNMFAPVCDRPSVAKLMGAQEPNVMETRRAEIH
jgi:hypothetical protein